ncbi:MAG: NFACT family protein [Candidatus Woesearchaeota archaeon]
MNFQAIPELKEKKLVSFEIYFLLKELKLLEGARLQRVYQPSEKDFLLDFHIPSTGRRYLRIILPNLAFLSQNKPQMPANIMRMCALLRKHLEGAFLTKIAQVGMERIVQLDFRVKSESYSLFLELFSRGNLILCDSKLNILGVVEEQEWSSRRIAPGLKYELPPKSINPLELSTESFKSLASSSDKSVVQFIATQLSMGGVYAEEICLRSGIDKNFKAAALSEDEIENILTAIKNLFAEKPSPSIIFYSEKIVDVTPIQLRRYSELRTQTFETFSSAIENAVSALSNAESPKIQHLNRIVEEQQKAFADLTKKAELAEKKAAAIYSHYNEIQKVLNFLREELHRSSISEAFDKLQSFKNIKSVNKKERKITFEFEE